MSVSVYYSILRRCLRQAFTDERTWDRSGSDSSRRKRKALDDNVSLRNLQSATGANRDVALERDCFELVRNRALG